MKHINTSAEQFPAQKQDALPPKDITKEEQERKKRELVKLQKTFFLAIRLAFIIPFLAVNAFAFARILQAGYVEYQVISSREIHFGGEFDPSLGAEISSKNGKVLVIVHERFAIESQPWSYEHDSNYLQYLKDVNLTRARYLENGDIVVEVEENGHWYQTPHAPQKNVLHMVTMANNGFPTPHVIFGNFSYDQRTTKLYGMLKGVGVTKVEMAGEFRSACVSQVATGFANNGFDVEYCDLCAFPQKIGGK